jgi:hypothetical protein
MSDLKGVSVILNLPRLRCCFFDLYQDLRALYRSVFARSRFGIPSHTATGKHLTARHSGWKARHRNPIRDLSDF